MTAAEVAKKEEKKEEKKPEEKSEAQFMPGIVAVFYWLPTAHRCQCTD